MGLTAEFQTLASLPGPGVSGILELDQGSLYGTVDATPLSPGGSVYRATSDGSVETIFNFQEATGVRPYGDLAFDNDRNILGITSSGGPKHGGTVFRLTRTGSLTLVASFDGKENWKPDGIVQSHNGIIYGFASAKDDVAYRETDARIYSISPSGMISVITYFFDLPTGGSPTSLLVTRSGEIFGTTYGGPAGRLTGTVFKMSASGHITPLFIQTCCAGDTRTFAPGLFEDTDGLLYGTLQSGRSYYEPDCGGTFFKISETQPFTPVGRFACNTIPVYENNPTKADDGSFYGTTLLGGDSRCGSIYQITADNLITNIYSFGSKNPFPRPRLLKGSDGILYGVTHSQGPSNQVGTLFGLRISRAPKLSETPRSQVVYQGSNVIFTVKAVGERPLFYQWFKNNTDLSNATNETLTLPTVTSKDSGLYGVTVRNRVGAIRSAGASLAVLGDGAADVQPEQICLSNAPAIKSEPAIDGLILVTHGWEPLGPLSDISWVYEMAQAIRSRTSPNYEVVAFDWTGGAWIPDPDFALASGAVLGALYAKNVIVQQNHRWKHIHLIAHSAGAAVIEAMAAVLQSSSLPPTIHETFLDPYTGFTALEGREAFGANADWADNYFGSNLLSDITPAILGLGFSTAGPLKNAYNVDISWVRSLVPQNPARIIPFGESARVALSTHSFAHNFYLNTITNGTEDWCGKGYGFSLSAEAASQQMAVALPTRGADPLSLCAPIDAFVPYSEASLESALLSLILLGGDAVAASSDAGISLFKEASVTLETFKRQPSHQSSLHTYNKVRTPWFAIAVTVTNAVNFVQFDSHFVTRGPSPAEGLVSVYWNTNRIGFVDERVSLNRLATHRFRLPSTENNGIFSLGFRLDSFNNTLSATTVTNISLGFFGAMKPILLKIEQRSGGSLHIAGPRGTYLIESSVDAMLWSPKALRYNETGTIEITNAFSSASSEYLRARLRL